MRTSRGGELQTDERPPSPEESASFKATEIGELPSTWDAVPFESSIVRKRVQIGKVNRRDYKKDGLIPVVDQGQSPVAGYWDSQAEAYSGDLPVIVFGDHTRVFKLVDCPFVAGADGVKVLVPNRASYDPVFLYFACKTLDLPSRGYNRHYALLKETMLPRPPLPEQRAIARVLRTVQEAIEATERVIAAAKELKRSMMEHLFTYGPVPINQADQVELKETETGPMPESWACCQLGDHLARTQYGLSVRAELAGTYPMLRMNNLVTGRVDTSDLKFVELSEGEFEKFRVAWQDVLFNRTNSYELVGKTSLFDLPGDFVFASYLIRLVTKRESLLPEYLNDYLNWDRTTRRLRGIATRGVSQSNISATKLKALEVTYPPIDAQRTIVKILSTVEERILQESQHQEGLQLLFQTLLHNLMTGKIRVTQTGMDLESKTHSVQTSGEDRMEEDT